MQTLILNRYIILFDIIYATQCLPPFPDVIELWYPQLITEGETVYLSKIVQRIVSKSTLSYGDVFNVVYSLIEELNDNFIKWQRDLLG